MGKKWQKKKWSGVVYCATNQLNGHRYIGVTCQLLCQRKGSHIGMAAKGNSQTHFHRAIRKYGKENFKFEIVAKYASYDEALSGEIKLIEETKPEYNMAPGGSGNVGWVPTAEQRRKISEAHKGNPGYWTKETLPVSFHEGRKKWNHSEKGRQSWSDCRKLGPKAAQRPVVCLEDGKIYDHAGLAAKFYGVNSQTICAVCNRSPIRKTAGGLVFRFLGDHLGGKEEADRIRHDRLVTRQRTAAIARSARVVSFYEGIFI